MQNFSFELVEGLNCISIPLELEDDNALWTNILSGIAFNSIKTLVDGEWKSYIRGRNSELNDFTQVELDKGYLVDVIRLGSFPQLLNPLPSTLQQKKLELNDSVYVDIHESLRSVPVRREGNLWLLLESADASSTALDYLTFTTDRDINIYLGYDSTATTLPYWLNNWDATLDQIITENHSYNLFRHTLSAGSFFSIPGNNMGGGDASQMYVVFVEENIFPISVNAPMFYQIAEFDEGVLSYLDRLYMITDLPEEVEGIDWIRTKYEDYTNTSGSYLDFNINSEGTVYVAYPEETCPIPAWLNSFMLMNEVLVTNAMTYRLYKKTFPAGNIVLGGASARTPEDEDDLVGLGPFATPNANYLVGIKKIGLASTTVTVEGFEPYDMITDIPIAGKLKGGLSLIGFPKGMGGTRSIAENLEARNLQYEQIMRLRKGVWEAYIPSRSEILNWTPADLDRGLGYMIKSAIDKDQILEIKYDT